MKFDSTIDYENIVKSWNIQPDYNKKIVWCRRCKGTGDLALYPRSYDITEVCPSCHGLCVHAPSLLKIWNVEPTEQNIMAYFWRMKHIIEHIEKNAVIA